MIYPTYQGLPKILTRHAGDELADLGLDLWFVKEVLENGYDWPSKERKREEIERCIRRKRAIYKVVAARSHSRLPKQDVWVIIHVSKFGGE